MEVTVRSPPQRLTYRIPLDEYSDSGPDILSYITLGGEDGAIPVARRTYHRSGKLSTRPVMNKALWDF